MNTIPYTPPDPLSSMNSNVLSANRRDLPYLNQGTALKADLLVRKSADITLMTAEGDKVTLSSQATLEAGYARYTAQGRAEGGTTETRSESAYLKKEFAFELSVEGDLSEEELKDIRKALQTLGKMTRDFFAGNTEKAVNRASKLMGLGSISQLDAVIQYERTASYQQSQGLAPPAREETEQAALPSDPALPKAMPAASPVESNPSVPASSSQIAQNAPVPQTSPPSQTTGTSPETPEAVTGEAKPDAEAKPETSATPAGKPVLQADVSHLVEKMTQVVVASSAETGRLAKYTHQFFEHLSLQYSLKAEEGEFEFNLVKKIQSTLMQKIEAAGTGTPEEAPQEALTP